MGHSEMGLAVAGLSESEIKQRTKDLASGDWSAFSSGERTAFQMAHRLTREPARITDGDIKGLVKAFGPHRALDVIWHAAWGNYMTRVADAFQFPLERENCFMPLKKDGKKR